MILIFFFFFLCRSGATVLREHPNINRKVLKTALKTSVGDSAVDTSERTAEALRVDFQGKMITLF